MESLVHKAWLTMAADEAEKFVGATAPNPPVGALIIKNGKLLAIGAHERAGGPHAEVHAINKAYETYGSGVLKGSQLYVTLAPCNHHGKTPPCTKAILDAGISQVIFGADDPNFKHSHADENELQRNGVTVLKVQSENCEKLIAPFRKLVTEGIPWVVHKLAYRLSTDGLTMIPDPGSMRTFTSPESLKRAHLERRQSDAILTGLNTVEADKPLFTVRHCSDHANKKRWLVVLTKKGKQPSVEWQNRQRSLGFEVLVASDISTTLKQLGELGALRVLLEVGPTLSDVVDREKLWDERLLFIVRDGEPDLIDHQYRRPLGV